MIMANLRSTSSVINASTHVQDPIAELEELFIEKTQMRRIRAGQCPVRRPVFLRLNGVAHGRFEVVEDLPDELKVGLFAQAKTYPAWVRYSCDIPDGAPERGETVGLGIKLFGVEGEKCLEPDESSPTVDFLLQNHPVFFVNDAQDMALAFRDFAAWIEAHEDTRAILAAMRKDVKSVLESELWSVIPFYFGLQKFCKYKIEPEVISLGPEPDFDAPGYLKADLHQRLMTSEVRLRFMVQLQEDDDCMPLDTATHEWDEVTSAPVHVATLILPIQDIDSRNQSVYGETLAFNPWRTLKEHQPVGSLAQARKVIYQASATVRRHYNGNVLGEPQVERPAQLKP